MKSDGNGERILAGGNRGEQEARAAGGGCGMPGLRLHELAAEASIEAPAEATFLVKNCANFAKSAGGSRGGA